mgnify:CR=1 FL=1
MGFGGGTGGSSSISSATDVALSSVAEAQQLQYNSGTTKWQNGPAASRLVESVNTVASSGSAVTLPDTTTATIHNITLSANCTFTFPAATAGKSFTVRITHGGTGFAVTWPVAVSWPNSVQPDLTSVSGKRDVFSFVCVNNGEWMGFVSGLNY